ncbi:unnamed protein product [Phytophthora fragariaefolia]|uniref:Unnamed protein product n=1 Tax=Phytophthora fragariaefolia TaxID=1490495 RepID=A0A9W6XWL1_9STRA|nr:unnamed protein product [Phytophthora fragariaefolia]
MYVAHKAFRPKHLVQRYAWGGFYSGKYHDQPHSIQLEPVKNVSGRKTRIGKTVAGLLQHQMTITQQILSEIGLQHSGPAAAALLENCGSLRSLFQRHVGRHKLPGSIGMIKSDAPKVLESSVAFVRCLIAQALCLSRRSTSRPGEASEAANRASSEATSSRNSVSSYSQGAGERGTGANASTTFAEDGP